MIVLVAACGTSLLSSYHRPTPISPCCMTTVLWRQAHRPFHGDTKGTCEEVVKEGMNHGRLLWMS